jgi:hypothetical protein
VNFGSPGSRNDISIYNQSRLFNDIRVGKWPDVEPEIVIGELFLTWFYMLSDGIYPKVKHLINSMVRDTAREKLFARQQEAVRKAVERVFAVLFSLFNIIYQPSGLFDNGHMKDVILACHSGENLGPVALIGVFQINGRVALISVVFVRSLFDQNSVRKYSEPIRRAALIWRSAERFGISARRRNSPSGCDRPPQLQQPTRFLEWRRKP